MMLPQWARNVFHSGALWERAMGRATPMDFLYMSYFWKDFCPHRLEVTIYISKILKSAQVCVYVWRSEVIIRCYP